MGLFTKFHTDEVGFCSSFQPEITETIGPLVTLVIAISIPHGSAFPVPNSTDVSAGFVIVLHVELVGFAIDIHAIVRIANQLLQAAVELLAVGYQEPVF